MIYDHTAGYIIIYIYNTIVYTTLHFTKLYIFFLVIISTF